MASTDATAIPVKNQAYRITFPIFDADGDLVTGAAGLDSEISKDAGTFTDCTNEATEIATSSGMYYLDLTSTEMNADTVVIIVKTSTTGAKTSPIVLYPQEAGDIKVNVTYWNGSAVATPAAAGYPAVTLKVGTGTGEVNLSSGGVPIQPGTGTGQVSLSSGAVTVGTNNDKTGYGLSAGAIQAIWDALTSALTTSGSIGKRLVDYLTGDIFARLGAPAGASIAADVAAVKSDTGTLATRLTSARAGYLDNLNIGGNVAGSSEVTAIQNNTRVVRVVPAVMERPDSGSVVYRIEVFLYDEIGNMEAPDSAPTIAVVDESGNSRNSNLDSTTMSSVSTGRYRSEYTVDDTDDLEQLIFTFSVIEGGATRLYGNTTQVVDTTAVDFTSSDRSKLDAVYNKLPSKTYLTGTANSDGDIQLDEATGTPADSSGTTTLLSRLTSTRAGYLDNLSGGAVATATKLLKYFQLAFRKDSAIATDNAAELTAINANGGSGAGNFDNTSEALEAIRDRGDAAWTTGGGGSLSDILNIIPMIPANVDLANTVTWRIALMLVNTLDDLPTTGEITPGTIDIDRKAIGGTSWTSVVSAAACSESAGMVYYDATFNSGAGYAEGDSLRITFKSQKITVSANDYEISDSTGRMFYGEIRQTERGTNSALLAASYTAPDNAGISSISGRIPSALVSGRMDSSVGAYQSGQAPLQPTTSGRTLDVNANGNAGVDWGNIDAPTTTVNLSGTTVKDASDVNTDTDALLARLTSLRAGYLDNLNIGGNVAGSSEVTAIQNNTRVVRVVPEVYERPDSGSIAYRIELLVYDTTGNMEAPDSAPTISVVNQGGTSRDGNLDSTTMSLVSTGRYRSTYTIDSAHALEQLVFAFSIVEGGATRVYANPSIVVDTTAADFTSADRAKLDAVKAITDQFNFTGTDVKATLDNETVTLTDASLTAAKFAANAVDANALANSAVAEIQSGLSTLTAAQVNTQMDIALADYDVVKWTNQLEPVLQDFFSLVGSIPTATDNADALLKRDMSAVIGEAALRSLLNVMRLFRNKVVIVGGTMTVYKEDDSTIAWTAAVGTDEDALPIVSVDP